MTHKTEFLLNLFSLIQLFTRGEGVGGCIWHITYNNFILLKLVDVYTLCNTPLSKIHNWWIFEESQLFGLYAIVWAVKYFHLGQAGYFTVLHNKDYLKCFYLLLFSIVLAFKWDTLISAAVTALPYVWNSSKLGTGLAVVQIFVQNINTCGILLQPHVKSQFVCGWTRGGQAAQVLNRETQINKMILSIKLSRNDSTFTEPLELCVNI